MSNSSIATEDADAERQQLPRENSITVHNVEECDVQLEAAD